MRKSDALYGSALNFLEQLIDSSSTADFYEDRQTAEEQERFLKLIDIARGHKAEIADLRGAAKHFDRWDDIYELPALFAEYFPSFELAGREKFRMVALLGALVAASELDLDETDISDEAYELRPISSAIPHAWFAKEGIELDGSMVYMDASNIPAVQIAITESALSARLIFHILAALGVQEGSFIGRFALVPRLSPPAGQDDVENFVRLHFAIAGLATHEPRRLLRTPTPLDPTALRLSMGYAQWKDALGVLSEYNSRDELLLKYLTLFQVIEALMFRLPIVELETGRGGAMFSMREFRRLYSAVDLNESEALKRLCKKLFSLTALGGTSLAAIIGEEWRVATVSKSGEVNFCLERLGLKFRVVNFSGAASYANFASLAYSIRNSIVHNKETEFHLTTETLSPGCVTVLEQFLLPSLEKLIFTVISTKGNGLWYEHKEILLY